MATRILIDGPGAQELETVVRAPLGRRPESEERILPFVGTQPPRFVNVLVPPGNGPWGWTYPGPGGGTPSLGGRPDPTA